MSTPKPPYYGAAYYPEDWAPQQIDQDIALMKEAGMNCMRVGEFAWSSMEPEEGRYTFKWLHTVVEKLGAADIAVIMGTPTATPPVWLIERWPETLFVTDEGKRTGHGARRHTCPNNLVFRDYCAKITRKMAEEFGQDDRIIGWQIDNEVFAIGAWPPRPCSCPACVSLFQRKMCEKFGTIEELNKAWCLTLWSMEYQSFDQLPPPRRDIWHHPSLLAEWAHFSSDSYCAYVKVQADILHELTTQPVGTDMMPFSGVDYYDMHTCLEMVQFNHYNDMDSLWRAAFWFDFMRPMKDTPFWNTETQTCWNGSVAINGGMKSPGWCRANSWLPVVLGGEANLYWLWRQHWTGQELMHGAVVSSCGRPLHIFDEVKEIAKGFDDAGEFLRETKPECSGLGLLFSQRAHRTYQFQPILQDFAYDVELMNRVYHPMLHAQLRPDVIVPQSDLTGYGVIVCSMLPALDEAGLRERLYAWVEAGGVLVIGPMSDIRNLDAGKYIHAPFGSLEDWAGVYCKHSLPGFPTECGLSWADGEVSHGTLWFDGFEPRDCQVIAEYTDGPNEGLAAVTCRKVGAGQIIALGTMPIPDDLVDLLKRAGARPVADASANVLVAPRSGVGGAGMVALELENKPGYIELAGPMVDLTTGKTHEGRVEMTPYKLMVLRA